MYADELGDSGEEDDEGSDLSSSHLEQIEEHILEIEEKQVSTSDNELKKKRNTIVQKMDYDLSSSDEEQRNIKVDQNQITAIPEHSDEGSAEENKSNEA